jgi:hypothetical protein
MRAALLFVFALGCSSQNLGPAITCSDIAFTNSGTDCSFVEPTDCSDGQAYGIECQDDATCTCLENGQAVTAFIASNTPTGYCANVTASSLHDLAKQCGWNINP